MCRRWKSAVSSHAHTDAIRHTDAYEFADGDDDDGGDAYLHQYCRTYSNGHVDCLGNANRNFVPFDNADVHESADGDLYCLTYVQPYC